MKPFNYSEPASLSEAIEVLASYGRKARVMAGGTDLIVAMKEGREKPEILVNIQAIPGLDQIALEGETLRIGSLATIAAIERSSWVHKNASILAQTANQMANPGVRNMATVGGNLCNAASSADMAPPLIALGALATVVGMDGERIIPVEDFFEGPGKNTLREGEILTCVHVPSLSLLTGAAYVKMPARTSLGLALVSVAAVLRMEDKADSVADAKIALGAVAPTPVRARRAESVLSGKPLDRRLMEEAARQAAQESRPISDVRGSAEYRREMVRVVTMRALLQAARGNRKEEDA